MNKELKDANRREIYSQPVFVKQDREYEIREVADCVRQLATYVQLLIGFRDKNSGLDNPVIRYADAPLAGIKKRMDRITDLGWPIKGEGKRGGKTGRKKGG